MVIHFCLPWARLGIFGVNGAKALIQNIALFQGLAIYATKPDGPEFGLA